MSNFISNLLDKLGHFFKGLFNEAERAWNKLEPEIQTALLHGSGVIAIVNENLDKTPDFVFELIQKKFPDLTEEKLKAGLVKVNEAFKIAEDINNADLLTLLKNLQTFLSSLHGSFWEGVSSTLAQLLSIALAPEMTPFAKISLLAEFVYNKFIKK